MFRILVIFFVLVVATHCEFNCDTCTCAIMGGANTLANCVNLTYPLKELESEEIQLGVDVVYLHFNKVSFKILPDYVFAKAYVGNLKKIELKSCGIELIENRAFRNLTRLRELNLSSNNITYLSLGTFHDNWNLTKLFCGSNKLEVLEDGLLSNLPFLEEVSFANNKIKEIGETFFAHNFNLKKILLFNNLLSYINGTMLRQLWKLEKLLISHNPWKCDCKLQSFHRIALKYEQLVVPDCNNTNNPENIRGTHWDALNSEHFICEPSITFTNITDLSSSKVTLVCKVTANPSPKITFYKSTQNSDRMVRTKALLTNDYTYVYKYIVEDINIELNNTYKCSAQNKLGANSKNIRINEIYFKYIGSKNKPIPIYSKIGSNISLECTRFSYQNTDIKWYFQNNTTINSTNYKYEINTTRSNEKGTISILIIRNIQSEDYGKYRCKNSLENDEQYFEILNETTVNHVTETSSNLTIIIVCIVLLIIVIIIAILSYFKWRKRYKNLRGNQMSNMSNDYVENRNEHMEESCIYISSDNNIYEDIK